MARKGIAPLSTTVRSSPLTATTERIRKVRERGRETIAGLPASAIWEPAHAIPPRRSGQSALPGLVRSNALLNDAALLNSQCVHGRNRCRAVCGNDGREE